MSLRVALVGPGYPPRAGGIELHLQRLAARLAALGCEVDVLVQARHSDGPLLEAVGRDPEAPEVTVRRFPSRTCSDRFPVAPGLAAHLARHGRRYDVIHGHSYHAAPATLAAFLRGAVPFVYTPHYHAGGHTLAARCLHAPYRRLGAAAFDAAGAVIANSHAEADLIRADFPQVAGRVSVLYPGVDTAALRTGPVLDPHGRVMLVAGRLERYKQVDRAVVALRWLAPDVHLVVVGTGPDDRRLRRAAAAVGVAARVRWAGRVTDGELRALQRSASAAVALSRHEAFGLSVLEAVVAGAPVVASDIPSHREIAGLVGGVRLVPADAPPEQVAAELEIAIDGERPEAERVPTWEDLAAGCFELYQQTIQKGAVRVD